MAVVRQEISQHPHHERQELCTTRRKYRQGRELTAVKVYTVNDESQHLIIQNVPSLSLRNELEKICKKHGRVTQLSPLPEYPSEQFVEAYLLKYDHIQSARFGKKFLDDKNFFGGSLHVCYAPELETPDESRQKLLQRKAAVEKQLVKLATEKESGTISENKTHSYRKRQDISMPISGPCLLKSPFVPKPPPQKTASLQVMPSNRRPIVVPRPLPLSNVIATEKAPVTAACTASVINVPRMIPRSVTQQQKRIIYHNNVKDSSTLPPPPPPPVCKETKAVGKRRYDFAFAGTSMEDVALAIRRKVMQVALPNLDVVLEKL